MINSDFSNLQSEIVDTTTRSHVDSTLRGLNSYNTIPIASTLRDSFVYNIDIKKCVLSDVATKNYIIDNDSNYANTAGDKVSVSSKYSVTQRGVCRLFNDATIKSIHENKWVTIYKASNPIQKYFLYSNGYSIDSYQYLVTLTSDKALRIDRGVVDVLTNVDNFWAGTSYGSVAVNTSLNIFVLKEGILYFYTSANTYTTTLKLNGLNKSSFASYTFHPVYQYPQPIDDVIIGYSHAAVVSGSKLSETSYASSKSIFDVDKEFSSTIKKCIIVDSATDDRISRYVLLESGELWVKGDNQYSQLGIPGGATIIEDWTLVSGLYESIHVGTFHQSLDDPSKWYQYPYVVGIEKSTLYAYKWGGFWVGSTTNIDTPTLILALPVTKCQVIRQYTYVPATYTPTTYAPTKGVMLLTTSGDVYSCGASDLPILGLSPSFGSSPLQTLQNAPEKLDLIEPMTDIYIQSNTDGYVRSYSSHAYINARGLLIGESGNMYTCYYDQQWYYNRVL